jgi:hypothetical protein
MLRYHFNKAKKFLSCITPHDIEIIKNRCKSIQVAEKQLLTEGRPAFHRCYNGCEGLCCRNLDIDAIIGFGDFIYLLTVNKELEESIAACLEQKKSFFTADCVFLINGKGPCLFPETSRPEVCITTFCFDAKSVKNEIRRVKQEFMKLNIYINLLNFKLLFRIRGSRNSLFQASLF